MLSVKARIVTLAVLVMVILASYTSFCFAKTKIVIWTDPRKPQIDFVTGVAEAYMAMDPSIEIELQNGWIDKLEVATVGGVAPDVIFYDGGSVPKMVLNGMLKSLDTYFEKDFNNRDYLPLFENFRIKGSI